MRRESIHPVPSVLDFHSMPGNISEHEHVGIQSAIDLREHRESTLSYRGGRNLEKEAMFDPTSLLIVEDAPLRYDVDIVTKLIVYSGIGFIAVFIVPILFHSMKKVLNE